MSVPVQVSGLRIRRVEGISSGLTAVSFKILREPVFWFKSKGRTRPVQQLKLVNQEDLVPSYPKCLFCQVFI